MLEIMQNYFSLERELIFKVVQILNSFLAPAHTAMPPAGLWVREMVGDNQTSPERRGSRKLKMVPLPGSVE